MDTWCICRASKGSCWRYSWSSLGRVAALDAVVAGLGISAAQAMRVARRLRRRLLVSPLCPPLIEIIPRAGVRYMITSDANEE